MPGGQGIETKRGGKSVIDLSNLSDAEAEFIAQALKDRLRGEPRAIATAPAPRPSVSEYPPAGKTEAKPLNPPPPPPPPKTDAERIKDLEARVKVLESFQGGVRSELWKDWGQVQDQIRAELHRVHDRFESFLARAKAQPPVPLRIDDAPMEVNPAALGPTSSFLPEERCSVCHEPVVIEIGGDGRSTGGWVHAWTAQGLMRPIGYDGHRAELELPF
jgi:hypothetical protein